MSPIRQILWKLLVVGMIPFILGAGLPQMECRCAAARGQLWCECCFRKSDESQSTKSPLKACCQRRLALRNETTSVVAREPVSGCPTCQQFTNPKTGSCCSLKKADAPTLSKLVDAPDLGIELVWLRLSAVDPQALVTTNASHDVLLRANLVPPVDRVIAFEHLLI